MSTGRNGTYKISDDIGFGYVSTDDDAGLKEYDQIILFTPAELKSFAEEVWRACLDAFHHGSREGCPADVLKSWDDEVARRFADYWKERGSK